MRIVELSQILRQLWRCFVFLWDDLAILLAGVFPG